ncbi:Hsp70 family protein [Anabaena sp. FACHB-1237]|uniref:Hsp70 family protein n=1 Tax=Anabaena sp. FACHB-1237 TaxID=2692769 RepID=UPI0016800631|nr:Hsp70 family protein [Anabaena sp. FACHB-1237]MBD2136320.1 Hsp70 family protein [Anabaena sp. FACHB-1237]
MAIAIDFGTTNTVITRWNAVTQQPETLTLPGLSIQQYMIPPVIPSLVYVEDARLQQIIIGRKVSDRGLDLKTDTRFFQSFKRGIGANIQGFLPEIDEEQITFEKIGQWFLQKIISELIIQEGNLDSLILTAPVDSFEIYRHWLGKVCQSLAIQEIKMLDEPTAAALGYGLNVGENILVIDFGGGTLDLSLVNLEINQDTNVKSVGFLLKWGNYSLAETSKQKVKTARVIAKAGQNLGGNDIDNWIVDHFAKTQGLPINSLTTRLAERLKIQLSSEYKANEVYFDDENCESYQMQLDRETLENILDHHKFFDQLHNLMNKLLQQARRYDIEIKDINKVLLVGGSVQLPTVQNWVKEYFEPQKIKCEHPLEAIAKGALQITQGIEIKDYLYHSYGVRYWDRLNHKHNWHPIIRSGQPYPITKPIELILGASVENQPSIELIIAELGVDKGTTEVYFEGDRLITKQIDQRATIVKPLNDQEGSRQIAHLSPPGFPGTDRVKIMFQVDEKRFLRITVEDLFNNNILLENQLVAQLS